MSYKERKHAEYPRLNMKGGTVMKRVSFDYIKFLDPELGQSINKNIVRQHSLLMDKMSIDKLTFKYHRDFLNEGDIPEELEKLKNGLKVTFLKGAVTIRAYGEWFWIDLHREYMPLDKPLSEYVETVLRYLILCTKLFKLPIHKETEEYEGGTIKEKDYSEFSNITTDEEYFQSIYDQRQLDCIELCFDFHGFRMMPYLPKEFRFNIEKNTYYLNDYRKYRNGSKHRSMITLYDKRKQQEDKKPRHVRGIWERFEIRLYPYSFSCMKGDKGLELLNHTYEELLDIVSKPIKSHIKRYGMDFTEFREHLPEGYERLYMLLSVPKK